MICCITACEYWSLSLQFPACADTIVHCRGGQRCSCSLASIFSLSSFNVVASPVGAGADPFCTFSLLDHNWNSESICLLHAFRVFCFQLHFCFCKLRHSIRSFPVPSFCFPRSTTVLGGGPFSTLQSMVLGPSPTEGDLAVVVGGCHYNDSNSQRGSLCHSNELWIFDVGKQNWAMRLSLFVM